jgi:4-amino-4-deoxy-L-arabinose transferase-like glycosyltransferase
MQDAVYPVPQPGADMSVSCLSPGAGATARDVLLVLLVVGAVIGIVAVAPSNTYDYAQLQQIGAVVGTIHSGDWLLPRDQLGLLARKSQLYAWIGAPILMATGIYNDFTFRLPTVIASLVAGVLVYFLGRRWYGRSAGLLAALLWATAHHMGKLIYIALTDMLLAVWVLASMMCADRLLFHRAPPDKRRRWVLGLWVTMILGAMTKGWGVLNLILVGGTLALATAAGPGFGALRAV